MLLILAPPDDETAKRLVQYAQSNNVACEVAQDWSNVTVSMIAESDGRVTVDLRIGATQTAVTAIVNRGIFPLSKSTAGAQFRAAETLASWWSVLARFSGPVVNRSARQGFMPNVETLSLAASVPSLNLQPCGVIGADFCPVAFGAVTNVHRVRDGQYLGLLAAESTAMDAHEVHLFSPFDPSRTMRILLAGNRVFDLSNYRGLIEPQFAQRLRPLVSELRRRHATFCLIVLEQVTGLRILHADAFPGVHQYRHIEGDVHHALLEYLTL